MNKIIVIISALLILCLSQLGNADEVFSPPEILHQLDSLHQQAVIVRSHGEKIFQAELEAWERKGRTWRQVFSTVPAVVGREGFAPPGEKREGDGRTPSGIFSLKRAFGYSEKFPTSLDYRQATGNDFWVDDPESAQYNRWVTGAPQAKSFEKLRRDDDLYKYGIVIEYNTDPIIPGNGSAIFLHVWRGASSPTTGCVALSDENLLQILKWLDKSRRPVVAVGRP